MNEAWYATHYKKLFIVPLVLLILSLFILGFHYITTGDIVTKDVSLKGGISATLLIDTPVDLILLEQTLQKQLSTSDIVVRELSGFGGVSQKGVIIDADLSNDVLLQQALEDFFKVTLTKDTYSSEQVGSSLGESFYREMLKAILIAFILMGIVLLITYRTFIPSFAAIFAVVLNTLTTLALLNLFQIRISNAIIAALLLLIGYSVDTDVLMTSRVLRRKEGTVFDQLKTSFRTGITMTLTALAAMTIGFFFSQSEVLRDMFLTIGLGLIIDISSTYFMNAGILYI